MIKKTFLTLLGIFLFSVFSLTILFSVQPVRNTLVKAILETVEIKTGWTIKAAHFETAFPLQITIDGLRISKQNKTRVSLDHLDMSISPWDFLHGTLAFDSLNIEGLTSLFSSSSTFKPLFLPLRKVVFRNIHLSRINLYGLPEEISSLKISGSGELYLLQPYFSSSLKVVHENISSSPSSLLATFWKEDDRLDWTLCLDETAGGLLHKLSGIDAPFPIKLTALGSSASPLIDLKVKTELPNICDAGTHLLLSGQMEIIKDSYLKISNIKGHFLDSEISLTGRVAYDRAKRLIDGNLSIDPITVKDIGKIAPSLEFRGPIDMPLFTLDCTMPKISLGPFSITQIHSQGRGSLWKNEWSLRGNIENIPLTLSFNSDFVQKGSIKINKFVMTCPAGTLVGHLDIDPKTWEAQGRLEGNINDLKPFGDSLALPLAGSLDIAAKILPGTVKATIRGSDIIYGDIASEKLSVEANLKNIWGLLEGEVGVNAYHLNWKEHHLKDFSFGTAIAKKKNSWPFSLTATSMEDDIIDLSTSGKWHIGSRDFFIHLARLSGQIFATPFELKNSVNIFALNDELKISTCLLTLGEGDLRIETNLKLSDVSCMLDAKKIPTKIINKLLPEDFGINGDISCFLRLTGPPDDIQGSLALRGKNLEINDKNFAKIPIKQGKVEALLKDNFLIFEGAVYDSPHTMIFNGNIPLALSLYPISFELPSKSGMSANFKTAGKLTPLLELFGADTTTLEGDGALEIILGGTPEKPIVEATAAIKNGSFESLTTGALLNDIELTLIGNDKKLILQNFSGRDGSGGLVTAKGHILMQADLPFRFEVGIDKTTLLRLDYATMTTSGKVLFSGNLNQGKIEGDLLVDTAELHLPEKMPVQMKTVDVTFINEEEKENSPKKPKEPWPLELFLNCRFPSNAFVTGKNLESEWKGEFKVTGKVADPLLNGTLELIDGEYTFNGESFVSTQGSAHFSGPFGSKTTVYIVGEHQVDQTKIQAIFKGPIESPNLSFRSNPPMSQKEILSWLLFGHGIEEITPFQVAKLSREVLGFGGSNDGPESIFKQIGNRMGIDRIDISSADSSNALNDLSIRLGKYISQGIYVSLNKSINAEANQLAIEANLTPHFKVQAEIGDNAEGKMSIKWAKDY